MHLLLRVKSSEKAESPGHINGKDEENLDGLKLEHSIESSIEFSIEPIGEHGIIKKMSSTNESMTVHFSKPIAGYWDERDGKKRESMLAFTPPKLQSDDRKKIVSSIKAIEFQRVDELRNDEPRNDAWSRVLFSR